MAKKTSTTQIQETIPTEQPVVQDSNPAYDTLINELNAIDQATAQATEADAFDEFDEIEVETLPDEGVYEIRFTAVKPLPNKQLEVSVASADNSISFKFVWFGNSLTQNLPRLKTLFRSEQFAQATTSALLRGIVGQSAKIKVTYNGAFVNYNVV